MTITERAKTIYSSLGLVPTLVIAVVAAVVLWYAVGGVTGWLDSRGARNEAAAQKRLAEQAAQEAAAAKAESQRLRDELQVEKGRAAELDRRAGELEGERDKLLGDLGAAHSATSTARQSYETARRAPTRRAPAPPDLDRQRRERELCELYPDDERCKR